MKSSKTPSPSRSWSPPLARDGLGDVFLRVAAQLDALQPPAKALVRSVDATPSGTVHLLPTRQRIAEILHTNTKFRPVEEVQRRRHDVTASTDPVQREISAKTLSDDARLHQPHAMHTTGPPAAPLFVPVGGRARVLPSSDLARARRSLKRRSLALANLHATVAAGTNAWDVRQATPSSKQTLIAELVHRTSFSTQHIFHMSRKFKEIAGPAKSVISFVEFRTLLSDDVGALLLVIGVDADDGAFQQLAPAADLRAICATISASDSFLRRLFATFDGDGDGKIDFREFVLGLNGFIKGSLEDKVDALFAAYQSTTVECDGDNDQPSMERERTVAISDLLGLFQGDRQLYQELMRCVDEYFARIELRDEPLPNDTVAISRDDFVAASLAEPRLLETLTRPTTSLMFSEDAALRERLKAFVDRRGLGWSSMVDLQRRVRTISPTDRDFSLPSARVLQLLTEKSSDESDSEELNVLLRAYLAKASTTTPTTTPLVDVTALLQDLTVVLLHPTTTATPQDIDAKATYYFECFDADGDALLTRHELVSAVCAGFAHFGPSLTEVVHVLEDEDDDQDGELTKAQYLRAARRSPLILASLYTCL